MNTSALTTAQRQAALAMLLGALLFGCYLLTFSGIPTTDDERLLIDTTESLAVRGNLLLNETAYLGLIQTSSVEPAQPLLAVPLYWLAYHLPWAGNVHALFLFAPVITVLTALALFATAIDLGYSERTALVAALLFGLTTYVWPYTQMFFREPLMMFSLFTAAFLVQRWRRAYQNNQHRQWLYLGSVIVMLALVLFSKEAGIAVLPYLLLLAYPGRVSLKGSGKRIAAALVMLLAAASLSVLLIVVLSEQYQALTWRYDIMQRIRTFIAGLPGAWRGLVGFFISPGKAIWWYSPVLLLSLAAPALLPRSRWRESWLVIGLLLWFAVLYSAVRGEVWFGGTGWGPRYLLPLTPFLMISCLPALDRMLGHRHWWPRALLGFLALAGLAIQIGGVAVSIAEYDGYLIASTGQPPWLGPGMWSFRWSPALGSLLFLPQAPPKIRWLIEGVDWLMVGSFGVWIAGSIMGLALAARQRFLPRRAAGLLALGLPVSALALSGLALWRAYDDPRYRGGDEALAELLHYLSENAFPDDVILLSSTDYVPFFMNYYKGQATWYSMQTAPGERPSPEQAPLIESGGLDALAGEQARQIISRFQYSGTLYRGRPIWLVSEFSPWVEWSVRPVEWYMTRHNYKVDGRDFSSYARLTRYLPMIAPSAEQPPAQAFNVRFGDHIRLLGADVVSGNQEPVLEALTPGDHLGISLVWETEAVLAADYVVSVQIIGPDGLPLIQVDRQPVDGFESTTSWQPNQRIRDNYGFILPADTAPGVYQVWVLVYNWPEIENLPLTDASGGSLGEVLTLTTFEVH
jgi:hypothetical protein